MKRIIDKELLSGYRTGQRLCYDGKLYFVKRKFGLFYLDPKGEESQHDYYNAGSIHLHKENGQWTEDL